MGVVPMFVVLHKGRRVICYGLLEKLGQLFQFVCVIPLFILDVMTIG